MTAKLYLAIFSFLLLCSCAKTEPAAEETTGGTYFSIIQYASDQWETYHGQPRSMVKRVYFNGKEDSTLTNALEVDWASIFKVFFETDISDPKYVGQYNFSAFRDEITTTNSFYYEAKEPKLYTRKLQVMADYFTDKIKTIYIEAEKADRLGTKSLKLYYEPMESISIHEVETSKTGQRKELRVVYEFL